MGYLQTLTRKLPVFVSVLLPLLLLFHVVGPVPADLGIHAGELSPCPGPAHCAQRRFLSSDPASTFERLADVITRDRAAMVVEQNDEYLHAEMSSFFFGFVDDLELLIDATGVQSRSISRLGESDLGVNARRLADLDAFLKP